VDSSSCLTATQVRVVRDFYLGPSDSRGQNLYPGGEPYGSELAWAGTAIEPSASGPLTPSPTKSEPAT
jgi:hypothetical protein